MKALAQADAAARSRPASATCKVIAFSGLKDETHWVHMEIFEGSYGGRLGKDGMDAVDTLYANTRNNPIEDIETHLPLRVLRYELREDVAGAGKWRGGLGSVREFTFLERRRRLGRGRRPSLPAVGLPGRQRRHAGQARSVCRAAATRALPSKVPHMNIAQGRPLRLLRPGRRRLRQPAGARSGEGGRRRAGRRDLGRDGAQGLRRRGVGEGRRRPIGNREGTRRAHRLRGRPSQGRKHGFASRRPRRALRITTTTGRANSTPNT